MGYRDGRHPSYVWMSVMSETSLSFFGDGQGMRWCWENFQCGGVLLIWIVVEHGPAALAVGAGGVVWTFFSLIYHLSFLSLSVWETDID